MCIKEVEEERNDNPKLEERQDPQTEIQIVVCLYYLYFCEIAYFKQLFPLLKQVDPVGLEIAPWASPCFIVNLKIPPLTAPTICRAAADLPWGFSFFSERIVSVAPHPAPPPDHTHIFEDIFLLDTPSYFPNILTLYLISLK